MEHLDTDALGVEIGRLAAAAGIPLDVAQTEDMALHLSMVLEANRSFNLTSIEEPREGVRLHVVDSLTAIPELALAPHGALADLGSGAGYPGVPLCVATGRPTTLIESVGKKARFLLDVARALGDRRPITVENSRVEDFGRSRRDVFTAVVARAVAALPSLVELAAPLLLEGGVFLAMKGPITNDELLKGDSAAMVVGLRRVSARRLNLPEGSETRCVVAYERIGESRIELPRGVGLAQRRPLA